MCDLLPKHSERPSPFSVRNATMMDAGRRWARWNGCTAIWASCAGMPQWRITSASCTNMRLLDESSEAPSRRRSRVLNRIVRHGENANKPGEEDKNPPDHSPPLLDLDRWCRTQRGNHKTMGNAFPRIKKPEWSISISRRREWWGGGEVWRSSPSFSTTTHSILLLNMIVCVILLVCYRPVFLTSITSSKQRGRVRMMSAHVRHHLVVVRAVCYRKCHISNLHSMSVRLHTIYSILCTTVDGTSCE